MSVQVHRWVPLTAALQHCSVVVHHGGAGTSLASAAAGVGQVVVPQGADQFLNADSLSARGCATRATLDSDDVRAAVRGVLAGELDSAVAEVRNEIADMPTPAEVTPELTTAWSTASA